jgi:hypothetical protein
MICHSTIDGSMSWRDLKYGTWLGQALYSAFVMYPYEDLNRILTAASSYVYNREGPEGAKQSIEYKFIGWNKTLYFKSRDSAQDVKRCYSNAE